MRFSKSLHFRLDLLKVSAHCVVIALEYCCFKSKKARKKIKSYKPFIVGFEKLKFENLNFIKSIFSKNAFESRHFGLANGERIRSLALSVEIRQASTFVPRLLHQSLSLPYFGPMD